MLNILGALTQAKRPRERPGESARSVYLPKLGEAKHRRAEARSSGHEWTHEHGIREVISPYSGKMAPPTPSARESAPSTQAHAETQTQTESKTQAHAETQTQKASAASSSARTLSARASPSDPPVRTDRTVPSAPPYVPEPSSRRESAPSTPVPVVHYYPIKNDQAPWYSYSLRTVASNINYWNLDYDISRAILEKFGINRYKTKEHPIEVDYVVVWLHNKNKTQHETVLKKIAHSDPRNVIVALTNIEGDVEKLTKPLTARLYKLQKVDRLKIQDQEFELRLFKPEIPKVVLYTTEDDEGRWSLSNVWPEFIRQPKKTFLTGR